MGITAINVRNQFGGKVKEVIALVKSTEVSIAVL